MCSAPLFIYLHSLNFKNNQEYTMVNLRFGGYLLMAIGLINLRYQTGHHNALIHSMTIVVPGLLLLAATFIPKTQLILQKKNSQILVAILCALLMVYAFTN